MKNLGLSQPRIGLAFAIAIIADLIQCPLTAVTGTGIFAIPGEIADVILDCFVMAAMSGLLGFHWVFLPSLLVEGIPGLDLFPTWTASVAYVLWQRRREQAEPLTVSSSVVDHAAQIIKHPLPQMATALPVRRPFNESPVEKRLKNLNDLRDKNLISQTEFESKRQEVLNEL